MGRSRSRKALNDATESLVGKSSDDEMRATLGRPGAR